jgi:hypothetical protein
MSLAQLTEAIGVAARAAPLPQELLLRDIADHCGGPPPSTIRRIVRDWTTAGIILGDYRVRKKISAGFVYLVIEPKDAPPPKVTVPRYHQLGRVVSR